jgi:hypothetical protein
MARSPEARERRRRQRIEAQLTARRRHAEVRRQAETRRAGPAAVYRFKLFSTKEWGPQVERQKRFEFQCGGSEALKNRLGETGIFVWFEASTGGNHVYDFFFPKLRGEPTAATTEADYGVFESLAAYKKAWAPRGYEGFFDPDLSSPRRFAEFIDGLCEEKKATSVFWFKIFRDPALR